MLSLDGNRAFVLCRQGITGHVYHTKNVWVTWQKSELRSWLNTYFLNHAFTQDEQALILETTVTNPAHPSYHLDAEPDTLDRIFLLSMEEAQTLLDPLDGVSFPYTSSTVRKQDGKASWWLRTKGERQNQAAIIRADGVPDISYVNNNRNVVRPCMVIDTDLLPMQ